MAEEAVAGGEDQGRPEAGPPVEQPIAEKKREQDSADRRQREGGVGRRFGHASGGQRQRRDAPGIQGRLVPVLLATHLKIEPGAPFDDVAGQKGEPSLVGGRDDPLAERGQDENGGHERDEKGRPKAGIEEGTEAEGRNYRQSSAREIVRSGQSGWESDASPSACMTSA